MFYCSEALERRNLAHLTADGEHNGVSLVEISEIFPTQDASFYGVAPWSIDMLSHIIEGRLSQHVKLASHSRAPFHIIALCHYFIEDRLMD